MRAMFRAFAAGRYRLRVESLCGSSFVDGTAKKIAAQKLVLSGGRQSSYPYRGVHRGAGGLATAWSISAGMECMK
jgi:hypothetical protein